MIFYGNHHHDTNVIDRSLLFKRKEGSKMHLLHMAFFVAWICLSCQTPNDIFVVPVVAVAVVPFLLPGVTFIQPSVFAECFVNFHQNTTIFVSIRFVWERIRACRIGCAGAAVLQCTPRFASRTAHGISDLCVPMAFAGNITACRLPWTDRHDNILRFRACIVYT